MCAVVLLSVSFVAQSCVPDVSAVLVRSDRPPVSFSVFSIASQFIMGVGWLSVLYQLVYLSITGEGPAAMYTAFGCASCFHDWRVMRLLRAYSRAQGQAGTVPSPRVLAGGVERRLGPRPRRAPRTLPANTRTLCCVLWHNRHVRATERWGTPINLISWSSASFACVCCSSFSFERLCMRILCVIACPCYV